MIRSRLSDTRFGRLCHVRNEFDHQKRVRECLATDLSEEELGERGGVFEIPRWQVRGAIEQ